MSERLTENDILLQFWSDIKNVENASYENIQSDIIAYIKQMRHYKKLAEERGKVLEWYGERENYLYPEAGDYQVTNPPVMDDNGKLARQALEGDTP